MNRYFLAAILASTTLAVGPCFAADEPVAPPVGNSAFAADLLQQLNKDAQATNAGPKNSFFSPYSIAAAVGMAGEGARGNTATQINKVFHFDDPAVKQKATPDLQSQLNGKPGDKRPFELSVANAMWVDQSFPIDPAYVTLTHKLFDTGGVTPQDFRRDAEASRKHINDWVAAATHDKIKDLLPQGSITKDTGMVLTNAIYFLGTWQTPFDKNRTNDQDFHLLNGQSAQVPMMHGGNQTMLPYAQTNDLQIISLPYKTADKGPSDLSMLVLLPKKADGLLDMEKQVTAEKLDQWTAALKRTTVQVNLPKFKMTSQFELSKTLAAMGMPEAFTTKADFSGISQSADGKLYISAVIHKAFVDVNEQGTEAAAATGVTMIRATAVMAGERAVFTADHPFMFVIRHEPTGAILFMGNVLNPKE